jgi:hypothetical protein
MQLCCMQGQTGTSRLGCIWDGDAHTDMHLQEGAELHTLAVSQLAPQWHPDKRLAVVLQLCSQHAAAPGPAAPSCMHVLSLQPARQLCSCCLPRPSSRNSSFPIAGPAEAPKHPALRSCLCLLHQTMCTAAAAVGPAGSVRSLPRYPTSETFET